MNTVGGLKGNADKIVRFTYALGVILLLCGGLIYVAFRNERLLMFRWFDLLGLSTMVKSIRDVCAGMNPSAFVRFSLPDGLWVCSYVLLIMALWRFELKPPVILIALLIPVVAVFSEILQGVGLVPGTFDVADLMIYLAATVIAVLYCVIVRRI